MSISDRQHRAVEAAADALVRYQTNGLCRYGRVCGLCDCPAEYDEEWMLSRDGHAYSQAAEAIRAYEGVLNVDQ